jgi:hypothetical protein
MDLDGVGLRLDQVLRKPSELLRERRKPADSFAPAGAVLYNCGDATRFGRNTSRRGWTE